MKKGSAAWAAKPTAMASNGRQWTDMDDNVLQLLYDLIVLFGTHVILSVFLINAGFVPCGFIKNQQWAAYDV